VGVVGGIKTKSLLFFSKRSSPSPPSTGRARLLSTLGILAYAVALTAAGIYALYRGLRSSDLLYFAVHVAVSMVILTVGIHAFFVSVVNIISLKRKRSRGR